jgi:hypothetical protein
MTLKTSYQVVQMVITFYFRQHPGESKGATCTGFALYGDDLEVLLSDGRRLNISYSEYFQRLIESQPIALKGDQANGLRT